MSICTRHSSYWRRELDHINRLLQKLISHPDDELRQLSLELVATMAEGSPAMLRKQPVLLQTAVELAFRYHLHTSIACLFTPTLVKGDVGV